MRAIENEEGGMKNDEGNTSEDFRLKFHSSAFIFLGRAILTRQQIFQPRSALRAARHRFAKNHFIEP